jgi:hypothetical protein
MTSTQSSDPLLCKCGCGLDVPPTKPGAGGRRLFASIECYRAWWYRRFQWKRDHRILTGWLKPAKVVDERGWPVGFAPEGGDGPPMPAEELAVYLAAVVE